MSNGSVFTDIAGNYDRINRILSLGRDQAWRRKVVERLPSGRLLDLGGGTGAANEIFGSRSVVVVDPSPEMLALNPLRHRVVGVGERLPFADASFDAVFSAYVFRNLDSVPDTLEEIARVLRPGGKAGIVDLARPDNEVLAKLHRVGTRTVLKGVDLVARTDGEYGYLDRTLDKLPPPRDMFSRGRLCLEETWRMGPLGFVYGAILSHR